MTRPKADDFFASSMYPVTSLIAINNSDDYFILRNDRS
jgi:hypothetical protein